MVRKFLGFLQCVIALAVFVAPLSAHAEMRKVPRLNLFPEQRAAHQDKVDAARYAYHDRGTAYVDHLYTTHAEAGILEDDESLLFMEESDIDPKPVDIGQVADIIKENSQDTPQAGH